MNLIKPVNVIQGTKIPKGVDSENPLFKPGQYQSKKI